MPFYIEERNCVKAGGSKGKFAIIKLPEKLQVSCHTTKADAEVVLKDKNAVENKEKKCQNSTVIQSLVLQKAKFKTIGAAQAWVEEHNYKLAHNNKKPNETSKSFRFDQAEPKKFKEPSFRSVDIAIGVKAIIGKLK